LLLLQIACAEGEPRRPNILVAISDDQSYPHASVYGAAAFQTPALDRVAARGVVFDNAYVASPGCSPSRAAFLTGLNSWQLEAAGTHGSSFPKKFETFQDRLEAAGYTVGFTGKGWGPGNWKVSGRSRNPAGYEYSSETLAAPGGIKPVDYAANFRKFLAEKPKGQPFSFWYGSHEPHRQYEAGIGKANGIDPRTLAVPGFLPDSDVIRSDIADYAFEIRWFDRHLGDMLDALEEAGELDNTIVIVTADNGMPFPRAKATVYEYGVHVPLVIAWPEAWPEAWRSTELVSLLDVTATIYAASGVEPPAAQPLAGHSLRDGRDPDPSGKSAIYCGRERHTSARYLTRGYPQRCLRSGDYLYIVNFQSQRWPAGAPEVFVDPFWNPDSGEMDAAALSVGYKDIDASPSLDFLLENRNDDSLSSYFDLAVAHRPEFELFNVKNDPACLHNLAAEAGYAKVRDELHERLFAYLRETSDPRVTSVDADATWESYPRLQGAIRWFQVPEWVSEAERNPENWPAWLREHRPD
jgi:uncharacterized sulfatase